MLSASSDAGQHGLLTFSGKLSTLTSSFCLPDIGPAAFQRCGAIVLICVLLPFTDGLALLSLRVWCSKQRTISVIY